jgi:hypothetical protein
MSDQTTQPTEAEPTAAVDSPEGIDQQQQQAPQADWERDYKELQREFTRTRQQMTDPEYQAQVAQEWLSANGYALPESDPEPNEFVDPTDALRQELEELKQWRQEQQQQQHIAALEDYSERRMDELGIQSESARNWVASRAFVMNPKADGSIDFESALQEFEALQNDLQKQWMQSKRAPRAPGSGQAATQTKSLDDMSLQELQEWQLQQLHDMET